MISRKWILIGWIAGWVFSASNVVAITPERGPYLQTATPTGIVIKWRMALADASYNSIHYGTSPENLNNVATDNSFLQVDLDCGAGCTQQLVEKTVQLKGLIPHTRYYYAVGDINQPLTETEARGSFQTAPTPGAAVPIRIWVAGDSGLQSPASLQLRDNLKAFLADRPTDVLLMLGDNAYFDGTDYEHELGVFDHYPELLRHIPLWPAYGNHDAVVANALTQTGPYFDIFHLPTNGEAGGVASGTEAYYSFDHGNIHFVILDSTESDRSPGSPMFTWLESDLAANDKEWVIAYWHHPPYSKGTNDTDIIGLSIEMRQNAVSLLDQFGADMAITGHNHTYERSYFIDSHYGLSGEIVADPSLVLNGGNGRALPEPGADGAYTKSFAGGVKVPNSGMVHAVPGSTSRLSGGALNHPAMFFSTALMGSMILDVYGNRLDATFLSISGEVVDHFTIAHTPDTLSPIILSHKATQNNHVELVFSEPLDKATAEDIGNYSIDSGLVILSATLSPDGKRVDLTTAPMFSNVTYTLTVTSVKDFAGLNSIPASGIQVQFAGSNKRIFEFHDGLLPNAGYAGTRDSNIRETSPTTNFGILEDLWVDFISPDPISGLFGEVRVVLGWDLSEVPDTAKVESVVIELDITNGTPGDIEFFEAKTLWTESTVTWDTLSSPDSVGDEVLGTLVPRAFGRWTFALNSAGVKLVQDWIDGTRENNGFVLKTKTNNGIVMLSREVEDITKRPRLKIITVVDAEPPTINAPADIGPVEATGPASPVVLGTPTTSDNIGVTSVTNDAPAGGFPVGVTVVTWTAMDAAGNAATDTQNVTVQDTTPPTLAAPADKKVPNQGPVTPVNLGSPAASDAVGVQSVTHDAPPAGFPIGTHTVTWTARDAKGNSSTDTQEVIVKPDPVPVTVRFRDGMFPDIDYEGTRDSTIRENQPSTNFGNDTQLLADGWSSIEGKGKPSSARTIIKWDVSSIPSTAEILSAHVVFNIAKLSHTDYSTFEIQKPWDENTVSWNSLSGPGSIGNQVLGVLRARTVGPLVYDLTPQGLSLLQGWVDGSLANNGFIILNDESRNGIKIWSRESDTVLRPQLTVTYIDRW